MAHADGEKELVLGNKQLVSFFFVVLALCGVFFALGYMIGKNSSRTGISSLDGTRDTNLAAAPGDSALRQRTEEPEPLHPLDASNPPEAPKEPVREMEPPRTTAAIHTQPARETAEQPASRSAAVTFEPAAPEPGATYLQVAAQHRSDADNLMKTLREQNFPAVLADSSKPDLFRVLVGPYHRTADVAEAKARLKSLGFANAFMLK